MADLIDTTDIGDLYLSLSDHGEDLLRFLLVVDRDLLLTMHDRFEHELAQIRLQDIDDRAKYWTHSLDREHSVIVDEFVDIFAYGETESYLRFCLSYHSCYLLRDQGFEVGST